MRIQTCRQTELLQMLGVTTIGNHSHVGSQALGEDRHHLVHMFLRHLFPNGLQSDFQLISRLMLRLELYFCSMVPQMWQSNGFKSGELESHSVFSMNPFAFSRSAWRSHTVKFHAKISTHCWNINKSRRGLPFYEHVYSHKAAQKKEKKNSKKKYTEWAKNGHHFCTP